MATRHLGRGQLVCENKMTLTEEDRILLKNLYLLKGYGETNKGISYKVLEAENVNYFLDEAFEQWRKHLSLRQGK